MLTEGTFTEGAVVANFSCPALVNAQDSVSGCQATGSVAFAECRR
jgi:hypothetical protein